MTLSIVLRRHPPSFTTAGHHHSSLTTVNHCQLPPPSAAANCTVCHRLSPPVPIGHHLFSSTATSFCRQLAPFAIIHRHQLSPSVATNCYYPSLSTATTCHHLPLPFAPYRHHSLSSLAIAVCTVGHHLPPFARLIFLMT